jgi:hypothetical protein
MILGRPRQDLAHAAANVEVDLAGAVLASTVQRCGFSFARKRATMRTAVEGAQASSRAAALQLRPSPTLSTVRQRIRWWPWHLDDRACGSVSVRLAATTASRSS